MEKYYKALGLNNEATIEEIQNAYDKLSVELDPKNNNNLNFFKIEHDKVIEAYSILVDQNNRFKDADELKSNISILGAKNDKLEDFSNINISTPKLKNTKEIKQNQISKDKNISLNQNKGMFKNLFSFEGRIRRLEYGLSIIIWYVYLVISTLISRGELILFYIFFIPSLWFLWSQAAKRCHDRDNSGWWQIIPLYGLWMLFADGDKGENSYGSSPK